MYALLVLTVVCFPIPRGVRSELFVEQCAEQLFDAPRLIELRKCCLSEGDPFIVVTGNAVAPKGLDSVRIKHGETKYTKRNFPKDNTVYVVERMNGRISINQMKGPNYEKRIVNGKVETHITRSFGKQSPRRGTIQLCPT